MKRLGNNCSISQLCPTLQPHGLQHARPPCPSPTPGVYSNSCPLSWWCHPTVSASVVPFSSCLQSFPASRSFPTSQLLASGGQSVGASASVLPMNIQGWFPLGLIGWISLQFRDSQESFPIPQFKSINSSVFSLLYGPPVTSVHDYWKNHSFHCWQSDVSAKLSHCPPNVCSRLRLFSCVWVWSPGTFWLLV